MGMRIVLLVLSIMTSSCLYAQDVINAYAKVTDITGTTLTVSNANVTFDDFLVGEEIIIMQMQDDVIGANTGNDFGFGDVSAIASAGLYEKATIASVDLPGNEITLEASLSNTYNTGANSSVQIVSFPTYATYSTVDDLTALDWDGNIGGIFAIKVTGILTLNHDINLDGKGFRGGDLNPSNELNGNCDALAYRTDDGQYGRKGEGIYLNTNPAYVGGRGKMINGGGGGSKHNSGAGGGGNFTGGGMGGPGYNESVPAAGCPDDPSGDAGTGAGAYGGVDLSDYITANRIFMGGGGGGGQQDNAAGGDSEAGGDGGGIIFVQADEVSVPCGTGVSITANGIGFPYPGVDAGWEGAPGAGAGGSLLFQVNTWTLTCALVAEAKGGEGQTSTYTLPHGGGGGGGKGVSVFSGTVPGANFSTDNSQGVGGSNGAGDPAASGSADGGADEPTNPAYQGAGSDGVIESEEGPLPVELLFWKGIHAEGSNWLSWATASEQNNDYFTLERLMTSQAWQTIATIDGKGTSADVNDYSYEDRVVGSGLVYYRLSQTDYDGAHEQFDVITVESSIRKSNILLYPNPNDGLFKVQLPLESADKDIQFQVTGVSGQSHVVKYERVGSQIIFDFDTLPKGTYLLKIISGQAAQVLRVQIK